MSKKILVAFLFSFAYHPCLAVSDSDSMIPTATIVAQTNSTSDTQTQSADVSEIKAVDQTVSHMAQPTMAESQNEKSTITTSSSITVNDSASTSSPVKGGMDDKTLVELANAAFSGDTSAISKLKEASEQGDAKAQSALGAMFEGGYGVKQDYEEAVKWYRKAAIQGYAAAQANLGEMYARGLGVPYIILNAIKWNTKAAEQGFVPAQQNLERYETSPLQERNVVTSLMHEQRYDEAEIWINRAISQGLGFSWANDKRDELKHLRAVQNYNKTIEVGDAKHSIEMQSILMHKLKDEASNGDNSALSELKSWASKNNDIAQYLLGLYFEEQAEKVTDSAKSFSLAAYWLDKSALNMNADAELALGNMYESGDNIKFPHSNNKALTYYCKALVRGSFYASLASAKINDLRAKMGASRVDCN